MLVSSFLFFTLRKSHPEIQEQLTDLRRHLLESTNDMAPLKVWEMQGIKDLFQLIYTVEMQ